ncbi:hypothetical protein Sta7437_0717 [Stanieria cyanosphaera PCC 7437]|uniref:SnoaL-like domain-containing protein n=1 Tax=Stanieria cyanosphaera (strain ATCC 29371 / PCC 7437) TaxID=111780 RepID=K9XQH8_STAC7|nr:nuclear transport factor 2 family protein [Stanieria cyanosphaera]AFZ34311.1 hypothetical protein Sta7437_0717 [Stanieria cyanosphaera PCC 7437]
MAQVLPLVAFLFLFLGQMNSEQAIQAMVERQAYAWENADSSAIVQDFAENAIFIAAGTKFEGKEVIKQAAEDYFEQFTNTKVTIKRIIIDEFQGAVEWNWSDRNKKTGKNSQAEDAIIFELKDGKIVYWREYIEKKS